MKSLSQLIGGFHQMVLVLSVAGLSWLGMMAIHEFGHVLGVWLSGGKVAKVVLHPLAISRTDYSFNPRPLVSVWAGPIFGAAAPVLGWAVIRFFNWTERIFAQFFAGFCLIANGMYIGAGSFYRIGDAGEMIEFGTPMVILWAFGGTAAFCGMLLWHGLGSPLEFIKTQDKSLTVKSWFWFGVLCVTSVLMILFFRE